MAHNQEHFASQHQNGSSAGQWFSSTTTSANHWNDSHYDQHRDWSSGHMIEYSIDANGAFYRTTPGWIQANDWHYYYDGKQHTYAYKDGQYHDILEGNVVDPSPCREDASSTAYMSTQSVRSQMHYQAVPPTAAAHLAPHHAEGEAYHPISSSGSDTGSFHEAPRGVQIKSTPLPSHVGEPNDPAHRNAPRLPPAIRFPLPPPPGDMPATLSAAQLRDLTKRNTGENKHENVWRNEDPQQARRARRNSEAGQKASDAALREKQRRRRRSKSRSNSGCSIL